MASSQIRSENAPGLGPSGGFPFAWNSPPIPGTETVITTLRSDPFLSVPPTSDSELPLDLVRRLFPNNLESDDSLGIRLGHFTVQRRIGVGGMGSVFLATDEQLRRSVALKVLSPSLTSDPSAVLRFQNEARAAARLDHDNIARIFFYGEDAGLHYIAYEYIPGSNLRDVIRSKERLAPAEAVNYAMQLAAALSHTSAAGVIHRDIKPSNVLITQQFCRVGISLPWVTGHHLANDDRKCRWNSTILPRRIGWFFSLMIEQFLKNGSLGIGGLAGQHVIERATQRIDVTANIHAAWILGLLGRDVIKRSQRCSCDSQFCRA